MKLFYTLLSVVALLFSATNIAQAQTSEDSELYDPAPPADSAFVRVLYAGGDAIEPTLGGTSLGALSEAAIGDYVIIPGGEHALAGTSGDANLTIETGKYYSILIGGEVKLHEDTVLENPAKAQIRFYNLSDQTAALAAPEHNIRVFKEVAPMSGVDRDINAVALTLEALAGEVSAATFEKVELVRREGKSVAVFGSAGAYHALQVSDSVVK